MTELDPDSLPVNFEEAWAYYRGLSPEDSAARHIARDALLRQLLARTREAEHDKFHDSLTGLLNRDGITKFFDERRQQYRRATDATKTDLMFMVDLDKFKSINDNRGHDAGDKTLVQVARILELSFYRHGDAIARLGGDEFVGILLSGGRHEGQTVADRVRANAETIASADTSVAIPTFSIGLALIDYNKPFEESYRLVDQAMYAAKHAGGDQVYISSPGVIELPE